MAEEETKKLDENASKLEDLMVEGGLFSGVLDVDQELYLGNVTTLKTLLAGFVGQSVDVIRESDNDDDALDRVQELAWDLGGILLGQDKTYKPLSTQWNAPGGIDKFIAHWAGVEETDPLDRMQHALLRMLDEILDIAEIAGKEPDDDVQFQMEDIINRYAYLAIGMTPGQYANLDLSESDIEP